MIEAVELTKIYPGHATGVCDIDLVIGRGELVFTIGASGAGKTTLLKLLVGVEMPTEGALRVCGVQIDGGREREVRQLRRSVGIVFQDFQLLRNQSALANVEIGLLISKLETGMIRERALAALNTVGLQDKAGIDVERLSWGEQQRVAIARAIARKPKLILADEPTGNLDKDSAGRIINALLMANADGATVIIATHDLNIVERAGGRVLTLSQGQIVSDSLAVGRCEQ